MQTSNSGTLHGKFVVPEGLRPGTKQVLVTGAFGSVANAYFTAEGQQLSVTRGRITSPPPRPRPIVAVSDTYAVAKNAVLTVPASSGVLANDIASNNGIVPRITGHTNPAHGSVVLEDDGSFVYTPTTNYVGVDTYTYAIEYQQATTTAVVTITVYDPAAGAPIAVADTYTVTSGRVLTGVNVCANDSSPGHREFAVTSHTTPTKGVVTLESDGLLTYSPNVGIGALAPDVDVFSYTITDSAAQTASATVTINIIPPAAIVAGPDPVARDDTYYLSARPEHDPSLQNLQADLEAVYGVGDPRVAEILGQVQYVWLGVPQDPTLLPIHVVGNDTYTVPVRIVDFSQPATRVVESWGSTAATYRPSEAKNFGRLVSWVAEQRAAAAAALGHEPSEAEMDAYMDARFIIYSVASLAIQNNNWAPTNAGMWEDSFTYTIADATNKTSTATVHVVWAFPWVDPVAETFVSEEPLQVWGCDLYLPTLGDSAVSVELRETDLGLPRREPLRRATMARSALVIGWNRFVFDRPFLATANVSYALVALCNDDVTTVAVAKQGQYDATRGAWVTEQPYSVGVFLSSSNNGTWTPHQDTDLTFRVLSKEFSVLERRIALGTVTLAGDTDLRVDCNYDIPSDGCSVQFELALPGGSVVLVAPNQPLALAAPETGAMAVTAVLNGVSKFSPVLAPDVSVFHGPIGATGTYISRSMPAGPGSRVRIIFLGHFPSGSSIQVEIDPIVTGNPTGNWTIVPQLSTAAADHGFIEAQYEITGVNADFVKIRLTLSGSAAARPKVRDLRMMVM